MKTYQIAKTDLKVSRIAYGSAQIVPQDASISAEMRASAAKLVRTAHEQGINLFDLAAMYAGGNSEAVFGEVLAESPGFRNQIVIQTKGGAVANPARRPYGDTPYLIDCGRERLIASAEASLRRLRTDRVDVFLLHWPDLLAHPEEIASAFDVLHRSGKVRYFGVSNYTADQIELLRKYVSQPIVVNQIRLGLAQSYPIAAGLAQLQDWNVRLPQGYSSFANIINYCQLHDVQVQAFSPIRAVIRHQLINPPSDAPTHVIEAARVLADMAQEKNTSVPTLALAWLLHHPANILATIGGTNPQHIIDNCGADILSLTKEEWYRLFYSACSVQAASPDPSVC